MSSKKSVSGGGSILLKLLILVLVAILAYSVHSPRQQWKKQAADLALARERMDNLHNAAGQFFFFNRHFPETVDDLLSALDTTRVEAQPYNFVYERKQVELDLEGNRDSMLVDADDTMRIRHFQWEDRGLENFLRPDSTFGEYYHTLIWADLKPLYEGLGTDTLHLVSDSPILVRKRGHGDHDRNLWVSTDRFFEALPDSSRFTAGRSVFQPVKNYSFTLPLDEVAECPATELPFDIQHVAKYKYRGEYQFTVDGEEGQELTTLARRQAFLNEVKNRASDAIGAAFSVLADSATAAGDEQYRIPDDLKKEIVVKETLVEARKVRSGEVLVAENDDFRIARADSIAYYSTRELSESILFPEYRAGTAAQFAAVMEEPDVQELLGRVRLTATFDSVGHDTVGVAVYSPITGEERYAEGIQRLFEVDPPENHGSIYNGSRSWD